MGEVLRYSLSFCAVVAGVAVLVHLIRTSPVTNTQGGLVSRGWADWFALQLQDRFGVERESFLARLAKLTSIGTRYGVAAWTLLNFRSLSLLFWVLLWVLLLAIELLRKAAQFYVPAKWENVTLKLDPEHFWLIHLIILGSAELQLGGGVPWGLVVLLGCYILFAGESRVSILAALEDVTSCAWGIVAIMFLVGAPQVTLVSFALTLVAVLGARGVVRVIVGRSWLRRRFWWVAQFCFLTSLIVKALVVLDVLASFNS